MNSFWRVSWPTGVFGATVLAAVVGVIAGAPTIPNAWLGGMAFVVGVYLVLGALPLVVIALILDLVARSKGWPSPRPAVWMAGGLYVALAGFSGYLMGGAYTMASRHLSGSEFVPFGIMALWMQSLVIIPVVALVAGIVRLVIAQRGR